MQFNSTLSGLGPQINEARAFVKELGIKEENLKVYEAIFEGKQIEPKKENAHKKCQELAQELFDKLKDRSDKKELTPKVNNVYKIILYSQFSDEIKELGDFLNNYKTKIRWSGTDWHGIDELFNKLINGNFDTNLRMNLSIQLRESIKANRSNDTAWNIKIDKIIDPKGPISEFIKFMPRLPTTAAAPPTFPPVSVISLPPKPTIPPAKPSAPPAQTVTSSSSSARARSSADHSSSHNVGTSSLVAILAAAVAGQYLTKPQDTADALSLIYGPPVTSEPESKERETKTLEDKQVKKINILEDKQVRQKLESEKAMEEQALNKKVADSLLTLKGYIGHNDAPPDRHLAMAEEKLFGAPAGTFFIESTGKLPQRTFQLFYMSQTGAVLRIRLKPEVIVSGAALKRIFLGDNLGEPSPISLLPSSQEERLSRELRVHPGLDLERSTRAFFHREQDPDYGKRMLTGEPSGTFLTYVEKKRVGEERSILAYVDRNSEIKVVDVPKKTGEELNIQIGGFIKSKLEGCPNTTALFYKKGSGATIPILLSPDQIISNMALQTLPDDVLDKPLSIAPLHPGLDRPDTIGFFHGKQSSNYATRILTGQPPGTFFTYEEWEWSKDGTSIQKRAVVAYVDDSYGIRSATIPPFAPDPNLIDQQQPQHKIVEFINSLLEAHNISYYVPVPADEVQSLDALLNQEPFKSHYRKYGTKEGVERELAELNPGYYILRSSFGDLEVACVSPTRKVSYVTLFSKDEIQQTSPIQLTAVALERLINEAISLPIGSDVLTDVMQILNESGQTAGNIRVGGYNSFQVYEIVQTDNPLNYEIRLFVRDNVKKVVVPKTQIWRWMLLKTTESERSIVNALDQLEYLISYRNYVEAQNLLDAYHITVPSVFEPIGSPTEEGFIFDFEAEISPEKLKFFKKLGEELLKLVIPQGDAPPVFVYNLVELLILKDEDLSQYRDLFNVRDGEGRTLLMQMASQGIDRRFIHLLLDLGSDINAVDNLGRTAYELALMNPRAQGTAEILGERATRIRMDESI